MLFWPIFAASVALVVVTRIATDLHQFPLWLDESFTAYFTTRPSLDSFVKAVRRDTNPPLYYIVGWLWPFKSDSGLRFPSAIFTFAAAAMPFAWQSRLTIYQKAAWAALLLLWVPGQTASINARPGALVLALSAAQTLAFMGLLREPTTRKVAVWSGIAAAAIATHYFAAMLGIAQGIALLIVHRGAVVRCWPGLFALTPAFLLLAWHLPYLTNWVASEVVWYQRMTLPVAMGVIRWPISLSIVALLLLTIVVLLCLRLKAEPSPSEAKVAAIASTIGLLVVVAAATAFPFLAARYLTPFVPAILLGLVLLARAPLGYAACIAVLMPFSGPTAVANQVASLSTFGFESPARFLVARKVSGVIVSISTVEFINSIGRNAFVESAERPFRNAGLTTRATVLPAARSVSELTKLGQPFIWIYGGRSRESAPPDWDCRQASQILTCVPRE